VADSQPNLFMPQNELDQINEDGGFTLYHNKNRMILRLCLRAICIMLPYIIFICLFSGYMLRNLSSDPATLAAHGFIVFILSILPWFMGGIFMVIFLSTLISILNSRKPIVIVSKAGIYVDTVATHIGQLKWDEISSIRAYTLIYKCVGITLFDMKALCRRQGLRKTWLLQANAWCGPFNELFGIRSAPINIPQEYIPISADELVERIDKYRHENGIDLFGSFQMPNENANTWPPKPRLR